MSMLNKLKAQASSTFDDASKKASQAMDSAGKAGNKAYFQTQKKLAESNIQTQMKDWGAASFELFEQGKMDQVKSLHAKHLKEIERLRAQIAEFDAEISNS
mmetsp:Transcript_19962/g.59784  ORF Transcript_19962/g.59784 Transcript_19962/m.59784 type:complete len:101 (+) Transcript_19962:78-380(+)